MLKLRAFVFILMAVILVSCNPSQGLKTEEPVSAPISLEDRIPQNPQVVIGKLDNGLIYYIRENHRPEKRAELRLALNAGSIMEDDDQKGLAHFNEHMAFNGSKNFQKDEIINYLESIGMRFGSGLNAYTSFDETVYMLQVPTDDEVALEKGFQILSEWAHNLSFDSLEIEKERGVIREEWRLGRGADARIRDRQLPILLKNSRYAERLPIGDIAIIDTFPQERVKQFYQDWYRPDLMAVIAVGDFDKAQIEKYVRGYFEEIQGPDSIRTRDLLPVPDHDETLFAIASDPEATGSRISVYYKHEVLPVRKVADYRQSLIENIYNGMLNLRLNELTKQPEPPFIRGYSAKGSLVRTKEVYVLGAMVKDAGIPAGLEALLMEAERAKRFGFTETELERYKASLLRRIEKAYAERDKSESGPFAEEYVRNFLEGEPAPGIEYEAAVYEQFVQGITLEEVNRVADEWISEENRVILVSTPEKAGLDIPKEEELLAIITAVKEKQIAAYEDAVSEEPLLAETPVPGKTVQKKQIKEIGVTELKLSNGVTVVMKPTDFKNDQVLMSAYSPGGNSLASDEDYIAAATSIPIIREGGLGVFSKIELEKKLAGKIVSVFPSVGELTENIKAKASPEDLETMFQLIYLYFTQPRQDSTAYLSYQSRMKAQLENRDSDPATAMSDTFRVTLAQYHYRSRPWSLEMMKEMDLQKSMAFYRDRFADASDFTFFLVGNFDPEAIEPFLETYLGGLPSVPRNEMWRDVGIVAPTGVIRKSVIKGLEPQSYVKYAFPGNFTFNLIERRNLRAAIDILRIQLREQVREEKGGTYGVRINASMEHYPKEEYCVNIEFGCAPERVAELDSTIFGQIQALKDNGPSEDDLTKIKEIYKRNREVNLKDNDYWLNTLQFYYFNNEDPKNLYEMDRLMDELTGEDVQNAARNYINTENYVRVVLYPEKAE